MKAPTVCAVLVTLTQTKVTWKGGTSIEELSLSDWPVGISVGTFSWLLATVVCNGSRICVFGPQLKKWLEGLGGVAL